ncbi:hypothetical protein [Kitasatospora sp. NPDC088351]|uniref:hypothetical protein n=1 Tax=unclassified Kitasatospora TaxID=2633591 RepID=UPI003425FB6E
MIRRVYSWLRHEPGNRWFLHCSRSPLARLLRAERRRFEAELAQWLPEASERIRQRLRDSIANGPH